MHLGWPNWFILNTFCMGVPTRGWQVPVVSQASFEPTNSFAAQTLTGRHTQLLLRTRNPVRREKLIG